MGDRFGLFDETKGVWVVQEFGTYKSSGFKTDYVMGEGPYKKERGKETEDE